MGWVLMSEREVHRVEVLLTVVARRMSTSVAALVLCLTCHRKFLRRDEESAQP